MECHVITAILDGEQRVRDAGYLRRRMERDCGAAPRARTPRWHALAVWLAQKRETPPAMVGQNVTAHQT